MTLELERTFNRVVERYRKNLLLNAGKCEWDAFREKAGALFDYLESIEIAEVERRFFSAFKILLFLLFLTVVVILKIDLNSYPQLGRLKEAITFAAVAGCCYELYFYLSFRKYMQLKSILHKIRRQRFIRDIEKDFRDIDFSHIDISAACK